MINFPSTWQPVVVGVLAYVALVAALRISGKRTLTKWNAFTSWSPSHSVRYSPRR